MRVMGHKAPCRDYRGRNQFPSAPPSRKTLPHLVTILRVGDEGSRLPTRRTTTATATDHICPSRNPAFWLAEVPHLPGTELCPNLKY